MSSNNWMKPVEYELKRDEIRKKMRRTELDSKFSSIRKDLMKIPEEEEDHHFIIQQDEARIVENIRKIVTQCQQYSEALDSLWKACLSEKVKLFTKDHIASLAKEFVRVKIWRSSQDNLTELMMLAWIIGNWCLHFHQLPLEMVEMIEAEVQLLIENTSKKLNHLIIYHLTNICFIELGRATLLRKGIVSKIMTCKMFENKETDISTFLSNFIYNIPTPYKISVESKDHIISFLKATLQTSKEDPLLRLDCILITSKMLIINEGSFHRDVVLNLAENIRMYIEKLEDDVKYESSEDIFELLIRLYKKRDYNSSECCLYSQKMYAFLWKAVQEQMNIKMPEFNERFDAFQNQIWDFLYEFCQIKSPIIEIVLDDLCQRCISKEIGDYEQRAVKILCNSYQHYDEQSFQFWVDELLEHHPDEDMCITLLQVVEKCLEESSNPLLLRDSRDDLRDLLNELIFQQSKEIATLSSRIIHLQQQQTSNMLEEVQNTANESKSFKTACEILSTPLQAPNSQSIKQSASQYAIISQDYN